MSSGLRVAIYLNIFKDRPLTKNSLWCSNTLPIYIPKEIVFSIYLSCARLRYIESHDLITICNFNHKLVQLRNIRLGYNWRPSRDPFSHWHDTDLMIKNWELSYIVWAIDIFTEMLIMFPSWLIVSSSITEDISWTLLKTTERVAGCEYRSTTRYSRHIY